MVDSEKNGKRDLEGKNEGERSPTASICWQGKVKKKCGGGGATVMKDGQLKSTRTEKGSVPKKPQEQSKSETRSSQQAGHRGGIQGGGKGIWTRACVQVRHRTRPPVQQEGEGSLKDTPGAVRGLRDARRSKGELISWGEGTQSAGVITDRHR